MDPRGPESYGTALVQASTESGLGASYMQDPYDWTSDQVVHCLCTPDSPILGSNGRSQLPDADGFARVLRDEDIHGEALLTLVTKNMLHDAWGLKYGVCAKILNFIRKLQQQSLKYQGIRKEIIANERSLLQSVAQTSHRSSPHTRSPERGDMFLQSPSLNLTYGYREARDFPEQRPFGPLLSSAAVDTERLFNVPSETPKEAIGKGGSEVAPLAAQAHKETTFIDGNGQRRRRLTLAPAVVAPASSQAKRVFGAEEDALQGTLHEERSGSEDPAFGEEDIGLDSSSVTAGFPKLVDPSEHLKDQSTTPQNAAHHITDEVTVVSGIKRKRIQPTSVVQYGDDLTREGMSLGETRPPASSISGEQESDLTFKQPVLGKRAKRAVDQIYYGPFAFQVDEVFYSSTNRGAALEAEEQNLTLEQQEFCFNSLGQKSNAERSWVNSRMKFFFRSTTSDLVVRDGGREVAIIPYPDRLGKRNRPLSMTLLSRHADGILAHRTNRSIWATAAFSPGTITTTGPSNSFNVRDPLMAVDENSSNWDALLKWEHRVDDEILPVYGDSGSEGEYDLETWREMEAESGTIARPESRSKGRNLSLHEVEGAIDTVIKQLRNKWHRKELPKIQYKAWRYWAKARRDRTLTLQTDTLERRLKELELRIMGLRKAICDEEWTKIDQVFKQSNVMQASVFEQEECQWRDATLKSKQAPKKMHAPRRSPRKVKSNIPLPQDDEEDLYSEASTAAGDDTDSNLEDFVVDDEPSCDDEIVHLNEDTTMADIQDAIKSDTPMIAVGDPLPPCVGEKSREVLVTLEAQPQPRPTAASSFIDLTQASSTPSSPTLKAEPARIATPPVINSEEDSEAWFQRSRGKKPTFRPPPSVDTGTFIDLDTDSDCQVSVKPPTALPPLHDIERIRALSPTRLVEKQDRKRLLIWLITRTDDNKLEHIKTYLESLDMAGCFAQVKAGLKKMKAEKHVLPKKDPVTSNCILQIAAWYVGWTIPVKLDLQGISIPHIRVTLDNEEGFEAFYDSMLECLKHYRQLLSDPKNRRCGKRSAKSVVSETSDSSSSTSKPRSSFHPRAFASESQETRKKRDAALRRMREDNQRAQLRAQKKARRIELLSRVSAASTLQAEQQEEFEVILNPGKRDEQDFIRLNPKFGRGAQLKPHQKEGLRFMWREMTGDHDDLQGCLLAHTMGTGKTMQVIALLVALSDAANSPNQSVRDQIPVELHSSQTLILCPPALIENWWDEFLLWPPEPNHLGEIRKVNAIMRLEERISEILVWSREGGVLLMGYSTFRDLLQNRARTVKADAADAPAPLTEEQYRSISTALLEKPNIVVADEAHEFKNLHSKLSRVINQIACKSRIAMTGSPLSNNLGEYFALIDWIAPGYLGPYADFKNVYEDPIQTGLGQNQEPALYRESRKRLKALELEMEPKIHRAEASALHNSLCGKSEFVIRVPLTAFQARLYSGFISVIEAVNGNMELGAPKKNLLSYLSMLQLLCNHPGIYYNKLLEEQNNFRHEAKSGLPRNNSVAKTIGNLQSNSENDRDESSMIGLVMNLEEDLDPLPRTVRSIALREARQAVSELEGAVHSLHLSNKMQVLMEVIELSLKARDKVLVFSRRLATLNYIGTLLKERKRSFSRIDGTTHPQRRQEVTKSFNEGSDAICLISTKAGGQGLNMFAANRVVIFDSDFSPMWEQQAVGRAYRIGQKKHVYVYRLNVAGTFEEVMQNQALFKEQLATRVLEKKNPNRVGSKSAKQYLFRPKHVENDEVETFLGKDTAVLDHLLMDQEKTPIVSITPSETFYLDDGNDLTAQERKEAEQLLKDEQLRRRNPTQYQAMLQQRLRLPIYGAPSSHQPSPQPSTYFGQKLGDPSSANAPAYSVNAHSRDIGTRLVNRIADLFPSGSPPPARRERAPKAVRLEAKSNLLALVLQKHVPHPQKTAGRLQILIDQNAKDEKDYLRLWRGIGSLLKRPDVNPNTLLGEMIDKLGEPGQPQPNSQTKRSDSLCTETTSYSENDPVGRLAPEDDPPKSPRPVEAPVVKPIDAAAFEPTTPPNPQSENVKRALTETESTRPTKKHKHRSVDSADFASMGAMGKQFDRLLELERQRKN